MPKEDLEAQMLQQLEASAPQAVDSFKKANEARERDDLDLAASQYEETLKLAPGFAHALRRFCEVESRRGNFSHAVHLCLEAVDQEASPENHIALALTFLSNEDKAPASDSQKRDALGLADKAVRAAPEDLFILQSSCQVAMLARSPHHLRACTDRLEALAPNDPQTDSYVFFNALYEENPITASRAIESARAHGLSSPALAHLEKVYAQAVPLPLRYAWRAIQVTALWLLGFLTLLLLGLSLSALTLAAAARLPTEPTGRATGFAGLLRRVYRVVLLLSCGYYYATLPFLAVGIAVVGGGLIYVLATSGLISPRLFVLITIIGIGTFVSLLAIVMSIFSRRTAEDPGEQLDLTQEPRLAALLQEVAARLRTRPVDAVFITPGTELAVFERGGLLKQWAGRSERVLVLGAGTLAGMKVRPFKAILGHEYGHLQNEDTAGGGFAFAVRRSLVDMTLNLAAGGVASVFNPAWWFARGFYSVFMRVSQGASRLQEMLADQWATFAYGSAALEAGLIHVITREVAFKAHVNATVREVVALKRPLVNLYAYVPAAKPDAAVLARQVQDAVGARPSHYDSHPSPGTRFERARRIAAAGADPEPDDSEDVWSLFADRVALERRMTDAFTSGLASRGIVIPYVPKAPAVDPA